MKIDNFALTMAQTCPAKYNLRMNEGWTARRRSGALGFGSCLHEGLAVWYRTGDLGASLLAINEKWPEGMPVDDFRTKEKCITTMIEYSKTYPSEGFKVVGMPDAPVIEVPFTLDTGMFLPCTHCNAVKVNTFRYEAQCSACGTDKEPIEYGGIYDMLVEFGGQMFVVDHKSTSILGGGYFNQFKPNNQMTGYIWAANLLSGYHFDDPSVRPLVTGAIINAIGIYKKGATKFEREITSRTYTEIHEWLGNLYAECCVLQNFKQTGQWPMRTGACTLYGLCEYHSVHSLAHPVERMKRLESDFVQDKWDFENRD